jgi:hypothetical protein
VTKHFHVEYRGSVPPASEKLSGSLTRGAKLIALLLLEVACTASSIAFLLSFAIAMPRLAEQFKSWLETGRWSEITHATMSSTSHSNGLLGLIAYLLPGGQAI